MEIENEVTVSTHNGSQVARQHSLRNPKVIAKEDRIYPNYKMKNLVYQHLFDRVGGYPLVE